MSAPPARTSAVGAEKVAVAAGPFMFPTVLEPASVAAEQYQGDGDGDQGRGVAVVDAVGDGVALALAPGVGDGLGELLGAHAMTRSALLPWSNTTPSPFARYTMSNGALKSALDAAPSTNPGVL